MKIVAYIINAICWVAVNPISDYWYAAETRLEAGVSNLLWLIWLILLSISMYVLLVKEN